MGEKWVPVNITYYNLLVRKKKSLLKSNVFSSDTESAEVRPKEESKRSKLVPLKFSFLKRNRDKVAHEDGNEATQMAAEEGEGGVDNTDKGVGKDEDGAKEGLVYAELDLVSGQNLRPIVKNDNEKTEYAEIVYAQNDSNQQQQQDDKKSAEEAKPSSENK